MQGSCQLHQGDEDCHWNSTATVSVFAQFMCINHSVDDTVSLSAASAQVQMQRIVVSLFHTQMSHEQQAWNAASQHSPRMEITVIWQQPQYQNITPKTGLFWNKMSSIFVSHTHPVISVTIISDSCHKSKTKTHVACFYGSVPSGSPSHGGYVAVYVFDVNQQSLPTPFYSVLVSISVFMALSTVFHSINSPNNSPLFHSILPVLFLPYWSFQLYVSVYVSFSSDVILCGWLGLKHQLTH